jgi:uncharacterized membrane-anchored protein YhcB (DUF1043 family)
MEIIAAFAVGLIVGAIVGIAIYREYNNGPHYG